MEKKGEKNKDFCEKVVSTSACVKLLLIEKCPKGCILPKTCFDKLDLGAVSVKTKKLLKKKIHLLPRGMKQKVAVMAV